VVTLKSNSAAAHPCSQCFSFGWIGLGGAMGSDGELFLLSPWAK